jgi:hypothetical protein
MSMKRALSKGADGGEPWKRWAVLKPRPEWQILKSVPWRFHVALYRLAGWFL